MTCIPIWMYYGLGITGYILGSIGIWLYLRDRERKILKEIKRFQNPMGGIVIPKKDWERIMEKIWGKE